jgi:uncharacterized protein YceK
LAACGCATAKNLGRDRPEPFGGTLMHCYYFCDARHTGGFANPLLVPVWLMDKPFSFAGDVVTLPYVLLRNPARGLVGESVEDAQRIAKDRGYLLTLTDDPFPMAGRVAPRRIEVGVKDGVVTAARIFPGVRW